MDDLIERIEALDGPSRDADCLIENALGLGRYKREPDTLIGDSDYVRQSPYPYTASIDAALTLVPDDLEWVLVAVSEAKRDPRFGRFQARINDLRYEDDPEGLGPQAIADGATPALALCAAALRSKEQDNG